MKTLFDLLDGGRMTCIKLRFGIVVGDDVNMLLKQFDFQTLGAIKDPSQFRASSTTSLPPVVLFV